METQHGDWLRQLAADSKGGVPLPSITRGEDYEKVFTLPIDVSGDTFAGALALAPDGDDLAALTVTPGAWDGEVNPVTITLSQGVVDGLPADQDADGLAELVYSIQRNGKRLFAGNVWISGKVAA